MEDLHQSIEALSLEDELLAEHPGLLVDRGEDPQRRLLDEVGPIRVVPFAEERNDREGE
jgi:hypothetical protein